MNEVRIFQNKAFGAVRVVEHNGAPWFVGNDVAKALGYERPNDAVNAHCKKINKFSYGNSPQGAMPYNIIPESDVYRLVMRSNLPGAVEFQDWICEEVIPALRRRGYYGVRPVPPSLPNFADPVEAVRAWADEREAAQLAQATAQAAIAERDHAIKTKAQISNKREASALGLLSAEKRRSEHYAEQLGIGRSWKAVKAIPWVTYSRRAGACGPYWQETQGVFERAGLRGAPDRRRALWQDQRLPRWGHQRIPQAAG